MMHHSEVALGCFLTLVGGETNPPGCFAGVLRATITALKICISDSCLRVGITGFCPGGAIPALGRGEPSAWIFVGAMLAGIAAARTTRVALEQRATQNT